MANEASVTLSRSAKIGGQTIGGVDELVPADTQIVYRQTVPTGSTNYAVDVDFTHAEIQVSALHSTQTVTLHLNTTSGTEIDLVKNVAQIYSINEPSTTPTIAEDVTVVYITNTSGFDALVQIGIGSNLAVGV